MDTNLLIAIAVLVVLVVIAAWLFERRQRTDRLKRQFGPEYERTVRTAGGTARGETALEARQRRVAQLDIRRLDPEERGRFSERWRAVQARFVDDPGGAVGDADALVGEAMQARGYPVGDFEQRAADVSVDHPVVVDHYRRAHEVALRLRDGRVTTEDLRRAMVDYRALFDDLLMPGEAPAQETAMNPAREAR
jgi:hypothetical protein